MTRGYVDPPSYRIRHQGQPALMLGVIMEKHWNGLELDTALADEEAQIHAELPLGIRFEKVSDQASKIRSAVDEFMLKFFVALAVVMLISLLALGFRVGIVVAAAVPLTLSLVFVIMLATGREFDRITLGALILSLGLLVDDAIIAIEMMVVKLEEGVDRIAAATFAWTSTAAPMLTGTLVTIIGFLPVGFARSGRRRVRRQHLLDRRLRTDRVVARGRLLHAVPRREAAAGDLARSRWPRRDLRRARTTRCSAQLVRSCIARRRLVIGVTVGAARRARGSAWAR